MIETMKISSREEWVKTSAIAKPGDVLILKAEGLWVDAVIPCSADGYPGAILYALGRPPRIPDDSRYFRLMGRIVESDTMPEEDDPAQTFPIGQGCTHNVFQAGRLFVFVNDRQGYYWNNWGSVTLSTEIRSSH